MSTLILTIICLALAGIALVEYRIIIRQDDEIKSYKKRLTERN